MDQSSFVNMERLLREDTKGEYTIAHMLGRGGMAVVYLATETQLSRKVALKVLPPELTFGHGVERFKREAKTAAALDHPNIIPIYRIASSGKLFWYAMKYLEGKSLEDLLREQGAFGLDETIEVLEQVADALDYAHEHHVIHRDVKPANVMLDNRNRVVVTDFGIAKALTEGKLTATDSVIGTPYFMSPEQGMGKAVTGASDQYSVAVMAYRMLAGHVPFDGDSAIDIVHKHCMFPAPTLQDDLPDLPRHVSLAVARALSKSGDDRFVTVHDFVQAMKDPHFVPRQPVRPSGKTVIMDSSETRKKASAAGRVAATGKGRTVQQPPPTVKATVRRAPRPSAVARKSKRGIFAAVGLVLVGATAFGYWQLGKPRPGVSSPAASSLDASAAGPGPITASPQSPPDAADATLAAANTAGAGTVLPDDGATKTPVTDPPAAKSSPAAPRQAAPKPATGAPTRSAQVLASPPASSRPEPTTQAPPQTSTPTPQVTDAGLATLQIVFTPPADVELDGAAIGQKSRMNEKLAAGTHRLRATKDGFATKDTLINLTAGETARLNIKLEPRQP